MTKTSEVASGKTVAAALALDAPQRASSMGWNSTLRRLGALGLVASAALFTANARAGERRHPCDAQFGLDVLRVLAHAQQQLDQRSGSYFPPPG